MTVSRSQPNSGETILMNRLQQETQLSSGNYPRTRKAVADAIDEIAALKARVAELEGALQFIADGYENHNVSHVDYRVKVYQVALDALSHAGPVARDGER